jgi:hypothetical protein
MLPSGDALNKFPSGLLKKKLLRRPEGTAPGALGHFNPS